MPTAVFPFLLAVVAALGGFFFAHRHTNEPNALVSRILYAIAFGCVILGFVALAMAPYR